MILFNRRGQKAPPRLYKTPPGEKSLLYADMLKQPHLLVAGATGSGKSVVINGLIYTVLYQIPGDGTGAAAFVLIDPKRVELSEYRQLPHSVYYASEPSDIRSAFVYAMQQTESRFSAMQRQGVRKYAGGDLYVIIDEWADIITTQPPETVRTVQRLAQIGRAARVHIVLATQTPIAKILPTEIKCNFDSRLALRTRSAQDSRNITGRAGCEKLPRFGYGYYMTPEGERIEKLHYYTDEEITTRVDWWKNQG